MGTILLLVFSRAIFTKSHDAMRAHCLGYQIPPKCHYYCAAKKTLSSLPLLKSSAFYSFKVTTFALCLMEFDTQIIRTHVQQYSI